MARVVVAIAVVASALSFAERGDGRGNVEGTRHTQIASPPAAAPESRANGASANVSFSQDNREARFMAYDSEASNLVRTDRNARRDIFLLRRARAEGDLSGTLSIISRRSGRRGAQANGDSVRASVDGDVRHLPHCVVFESQATNLDRRDRTRDWDVYLRELRRERTVLVSVGERNARNAVVDGRCELVTYESRGIVVVRDLETGRRYRIARGRNPDQQTNGKGVAYERGGQVYYRAYQVVERRGRRVVRRRGREVLVSSAASGRPGNGVSGDPAMDDRGYYVAFESTATDLCVNRCSGVSEDRNGPVSDVFRRTLSRQAPTKDVMQMVSYSFPPDVQGNGPSNNPAITSAGENIVFDTAATNLRQRSRNEPRHWNGTVRDIYYWNFPADQGHGATSRESPPGHFGSLYAGPSENPATSSRANYIGWVAVEAPPGAATGSSIHEAFIRFMGGYSGDTETP